MEAGGIVVRSCASFVDVFGLGFSGFMVVIRVCVQLADAALYHKELAVAERCYAALGDVAKARYIHKVHQCDNFN